MDVERAQILYRRCTVSIWGSLLCVLVGWPLLFNELLPLRQVGIALNLLALVLGFAFYVFLAALVSLLGKSVLVWVGGAFVAGPIGPLVAWFSMRRIAKQGFVLSESGPSKSTVGLDTGKSGARPSQ